MAYGGSEGGVDLQAMAERVWGALDHMAETDPQQYEKFIEQQLKEGEEAMSSPEPVLCLRCPLGGVSEVTALALAL